MAASQRWNTKNWPIDYIGRLCDILAGHNVRVVLTGVEKDKEIARQLLTFTKAKPANVVGKTDVMELAALIKRCKVFVTPDSAPMHIAAAMKVPFIAFFGPTSSLRHLPPTKSCFVFEKKLECAPCYNSECRITTHACMREITPEQVAGKVLELMKE